MAMIFLLLVLGLSFVVCLALIPLARACALRQGWVDQPDGHRKIHKKPTPVSGGLAVFSSCIIAVGGILLIPSAMRSELLQHASLLTGLLLGGLVICAVGIADDFGHLRGWHKLLGQTLAVSMVIGMGVWVRGIHFLGMEIDLGWFGFPFTLFFMLGAINSLNLMDGMDGLLGSVGAVLSLALAAMACLAGHWWAATIALSLAGALLGFLRYNLPPASIFLGDSGSMLVGLVLGTLAIHCSLKAPATIAIAVPIALLVVTIFDTTAAILRRKLTGRSIYTTDRGHLHHCLLRHGFSALGVLVVITVCCLVAAGGAMASQSFNHEWIALVAAGSIIATLIATRLFGHSEAMLVKARLFSMFMPSNRVRHMEIRLQGSVDWKDLWQSLKGCAAELNLQKMLLDVNAPSLHEGYHARWDQMAEITEESTQLWHVEIPMAARGVAIGRLIVSGKPDAHPVWAKIAAVMKVVEDFHHPVSMLVGCGTGHGGHQVVASHSELKLAAKISPVLRPGFGIEAMQS